LLVIDLSDAVFAFTDRFDFAGGFARPLMVDDRPKGQALAHKTAIDAFALIDVGMEVRIERDGLHVASALRSDGPSSPGTHR
jgi:hypothetical protein